MALLEVNNLSIEFKNDSSKWLPTVTDVSFSLEKGEILALVGESGCGKSVSCMSLARLLPEPPARISSGEILLERGNGKSDILKLSQRELRKIRGSSIAYIFQEPSMSLNPVFRVGDQIAEAIMLHRPEVADPMKETISLLRQAGIPAPETRVKSYPHEMSGGMLQRVMIAMALSCNPDILVADEPTTALDVTIQAQILDLLAKLRRERDMSIILVTHNLGIVSELADRVCVMYAGRIVESASARAVIDSPRHPYTRDLISAVPVLGNEKTQLSTIPGIVPSPGNYLPGCRFADRCRLCATLNAADSERCRNVVPLLTDTSDDHFCACHFSERACEL